MLSTGSAGEPIGGDRLVEVGLGWGERIGRRVGAALGKELRSVEAVELLLGQPAQHVRDVGLVHALAEAALETVGIEQAHEQLEVRLLAVVRGRRHE